MCIEAAPNLPDSPITIPPRSVLASAQSITNQLVPFAGPIVRSPVIVFAPVVNAVAVAAFPLVF